MRASSKKPAKQKLSGYGNELDEYFAELGWEPRYRTIISARQQPGPVR